ncbi:hypothetical protein THRCLA_05834 [Thraustotheca clavata]|uniref:Uncharacterized protein n=1 Tax=Thraustotheca clavata TaxID=74557 RepID=A0A1V9ZSC8_9STRA|nr:hypothetical protein THRCLA_05834 [Thraustotheca clavata]
MERFIWFPFYVVAGLAIDESGSFDNTLVQTAPQISLGLKYSTVFAVLVVLGFIFGSVVAFILADEVIFKNQSYSTTACRVSFLVGGLLTTASTICLWKS